MESKKTLPFVLIAVLVIGVIFFFRSKNPGGSAKSLEVQSGEVVMSMRQDEYDPINIKIKKGTKVTFVNDSEDFRWPASDLHPSHLIFPDFDVKRAMSPGEKWSYTFEKVGEWGYHDHLAPYITGTIIVE